MTWMAATKKMLKLDQKSHGSYPTFAMPNKRFFIEYKRFFVA